MAHVPGPSGWRTRAVRADARLGDTLRGAGTRADGVRRGTRLTLAWSATHLELWRADGDVLVSYRWRDVGVPCLSHAVARWPRGRQAAVGLSVPGLPWLLVAPTHRPAGGHRTARPEDVDALVTELLEAWKGAWPAAAERVPVAAGGEERWIDVELNEAVLRLTSRQPALALGPEERAAPVTERWSPDEVATQAAIVMGEMRRVPQASPSTVSQEAERIRRYLTEHRPELAERTVSALLHDYCMENR